MAKINVKKPKKTDNLTKSFSVSAREDVLELISLFDLTVHVSTNLRALLNRAKNGKSDNSFDMYFSCNEKKRNSLERNLLKFKQLFENSSCMTCDVIIDNNECDNTSKKKYVATIEFLTNSSFAVNLYFGTFESAEFFALYHVEFVKK